MNDVKRVLIVEDLPADAELVEREVRRVLPKCEFLRVETRKDFLAALETFQPDIILSDYRLPQFDGMLALKLALEHVPDIPFIITTGSMNEDTAVECMKTGAWDYIIKQHLKRLGPAVLSCLEQKHQRTERQTAEAALRESEEHYRVLFDTTPIGIITALPQGQITGVNPAALLILGSPSAEATKSINLLTFPPLIKSGLVADFKNSVELCQPLSAERPYLSKWGKNIDLHYLISPIPDGAGRTASVQVIIQDISERKQAEVYRAMSREVLQILNEPGDMKDAIQRVLAAFKTHTKFDAIGIRLQDGDDFPYIAQIGFSKEFLLTENKLIEHSADGGVLRDKDGKVCLECKCGMVLSDKADPINPLLTPGGSFWTNDLLPLLDIPLDEDLRHNPRNQCIQQGYATVALVPIRSKDRIVGLIHLNDRSKGRLTLEIVELLEGIASHIGAALMRKQAEEQTKSSEERLKILFDYAPDAYYLSDLAGNFIDGNFAAEKLLGYDKNELIGKNFLKLKLLSAKQLPHAAKLLAKNVLGMATGPDEFELCRKNGLKIIVEISAHPVKIQDRTLVLGLARDVTARKLAEEAVRESEDRYRDLVENSNDLITTHDLEGNLLSMNKAAARVTGYSHADLLQMNLVDLIRPEMRRIFAAYLKKIRATGHARGFLQIVTAGGEIRTWEYDNTLRSDGMAVPIVRGMARDVTERKQAEEALWAKEEQEREFSKRLVKLLGAINLLAGEKSFDDLCRRAVETALENLGFDRVGLWFFSDNQQNSVGSFGTDETGHVRDERGIKIPISSETLKQLFKSTEPVLAFEQADLLNEKGEPVGKGQHTIASLSNGDQVIGYLAADNLIHGQPITHNDQELLSLFATTLAHLSTLKRAEESLRESEEKMRMIVEGTPFFFFYTQDTAGDMVYISPTVEKITGRTVVEWMGQKNWFATDNPINFKAPILTHLHLLGENNSEPLYFELTHKNGSVILLEIFESTIFRDGKVIGLQGVAHDITSRKKDEEKIKSNLDELQRWQDVMLDREDRVQEIKREVNELCRRLAEPVRYTSQESGAADSEEPSL